jgi:hypothetical protein
MRQRFRHRLGNRVEIDAIDVGRGIVALVVALGLREAGVVAPRLVGAAAARSRLMRIGRARGQRQQREQQRRQPAPRALAAEADFPFSLREKVARSAG